jgi:hypothetical protein
MRLRRSASATRHSAHCRALSWRDRSGLSPVVLSATPQDHPLRARGVCGVEGIIDGTSDGKSLLHLHAGASDHVGPFRNLRRDERLDFSQRHCGRLSAAARIDAITAGFSSALPISLLSLFTIPGGVFFGAQSPNQV